MGEFTEVVSGLARGPDMIGKQWAEACEIRVKGFRPAWQNPDGTTDKGMKRNALMAAYADRAVIFWDGKSKGTKNMIDQAFKEQIETHVYFLQPEVLSSTLQA